MKEKLEGKYFQLGLTIFFAGCALILFYYCVNNFKVISNGFSVIVAILTPFTLGAVMAYLMCPIYNLGVRSVYGFTQNKFETKKKAFKFSKVISTVLTMIVLIGIIFGFLALVIPSLVETVSGLITVLPGEFSSAVDWLEKNISNDTNTLGVLKDILGTIEDGMIKWAKTEFLPSAGNIVASLSQGIFGVLSFLLNFLIGLILCVYFLNSKEFFLAQTKAIIKATMKEEKAKSLFELGTMADRTFGGFINGKLIDSLIIGILCFILMSILNLPYPTLISFIVGLTNIIPFFGPFIGAIPSTALILLVSPIQALYFAIMILVLQQVDGNIIGPKILGGTTGLSSFWVMFSIIVFGALFGFVGMVVGVPIFALVYTYFGRYIKKKLRRRGLDSNMSAYEGFESYGIDNKEDVL